MKITFVGSFIVIFAFLMGTRAFVNREGYLRDIRILEYEKSQILGRNGELEQELEKANETISCLAAVSLNPVVEDTTYTVARPPEGQMPLYLSRGGEAPRWWLLNSKEYKGVPTTGTFCLRARLETTTTKMVVAF